LSINIEAWGSCLPHQHPLGVYGENCAGHDSGNLPAFITGVIESAMGLHMSNFRIESTCNALKPTQLICDGRLQLFHREMNDIPSKASAVRITRVSTGRDLVL
jgi:hypothetical protein